MANKALCVIVDCFVHSHECCLCAIANYNSGVNCRFVMN